VKYALIIPDGAVDEPNADLDGKTPLQAAALSALNRLATGGRVGTACTLAPDRPPAAEDGLMSVIGYDPSRLHIARGPLEALARGLRPGPRDQIFRCNLVSLIDGYLRDPTAGYIATPEAARIIADLNAGLLEQNLQLHAGVSYRHLLVWKDVGPLPKLITTPPERVLDRPAKKFLPSGPDAEPLSRLIRWSQEVLAEHDVNAVRRDLGENVANSIWLWGQGPPAPSVPLFRQRFGLSGAVVAGADLMRGLAQLVGWDVLDAPGATGLMETDFAAKGRAAIAALDDHDLVCVHIEAADEAGQLGLAPEKCHALEAIDRDIVEPLVRRLEAESQWRLLVMPGHATSTASRTITADPVIFVMAGTGIDSNRGEAFDEPNGEIGEMHLERAADLMEYFLRR